MWCSGKGDGRGDGGCSQRSLAHSRDNALSLLMVLGMLPLMLVLYSCLQVQYKCITHSIMTAATPPSPAPLRNSLTASIPLTHSSVSDLSLPMVLGMLPLILVYCSHLPPPAISHSPAPYSRYTPCLCHCVCQAMCSHSAPPLLSLPGSHPPHALHACPSLTALSAC